MFLGVVRSRKVCEYGEGAIGGIGGKGQGRELLEDFLCDRHLASRAFLC